MHDISTITNSTQFDCHCIRLAFPLLPFDYDVNSGPTTFYQRPSTISLSTAVRLTSFNWPSDLALLQVPESISAHNILTCFRDPSLAHPMQYDLHHSHSIYSFHTAGAMNRSLMKQPLLHHPESPNGLYDDWCDTLRFSWHTTHHILTSVSTPHPMLGTAYNLIQLLLQVLFLMPFFASEKADHPFASTLLFLTSDLSRQHFFFYTRSCGSPCLNLRLILFLCVSHNRLVHDPALLRSICSARSEHIKQVYEPSCTTKPTHLLVSLPHLSASHLLALVFLCIIIS